MKFAACRDRPDKRVEFIQHGSVINALTWTLNFTAAALWETAEAIEQFKKDNKFPPETRATPMSAYDGRTCPYCGRELIKLDGTGRGVPRSEFDVECRGCGKKWQEIFKIESVVVA